MAVMLQCGWNLAILLLSEDSRYGQKEGQLDTHHSEARAAALRPQIFL